MPKPISTIDSLPPEAQAQIIAWLELESRSKVAERIAKPPPEGFGIRTHATTLARFFTRHQLKERQADLELAKSVAPNSTDPVDAATQSLLRDWAFNMATNPERDVEDFKALSRWLLRRTEKEQRDRQLDILQERLSFDRERYEFDTARTVLLHQMALAKIASDNTLDDEQKIDQARSLIFNRPISELPPRMPNIP
jgi:hypothetical protein